jgi:hypothetical protein
MVVFPDAAGFGVKLDRQNLNPSRIFWVFLLCGPACAALLQLLLVNAFFLDLLFDAPSLWLLVPIEISGLAETALILLFGFPVSFLVAVCAVSSYLALRRVNLLIVLAATLAAIWLENNFASDAYTGYFVSYGLRGPWQPDGPRPHPRQAIILVWLLHLIPASFCWWIVRNKRLPPL